jgi:8-oxo-dGTP pyrophosphatase MutT (NUDIX family)
VIVGGLLTVLYQRWTWGQRRVRAALRVSKAANAYDPGSDEILSLWTWSPNRRLKQASLRTVPVRPTADRRHLLAGEEFDALAAEFAASGAAGDNVQILGFERDYRESARSQSFEVTLGLTQYSEVLASQRLMASRPELRQQLRAHFDSDPNSFLAQVPPTSTSANVLVVSARGRVLALRRSRTVELFAGQWGFGINETMKYRDEGGGIEDFFAVVHRGLEEELGLFRDEYRGPEITAVTYRLLDDFGVTAVVQLQPHISEQEVIDRMWRSHSSFEHDDARWIPIRRATVNTLMRHGRVKGVDGEWIYFARFSLRELWRYRPR